MNEYDVRVLISAPSLETASNVSGIASVVRIIQKYTPRRFRFIHLKVGAQDSRHGASKLLGTLADIAKALVTVAKGQFDIFHCNMALNTKSILRDSTLLMVAKLRQKPVLLHIHGGQFMSDAPSPRLRAYLRWSLPKADRIVVLSKLERDALERLYGVPPAAVHFLYNFVDTSIAQLPRESREDVVNFVFAGRLVEEKGISDLITAIDATTGRKEMRFDFYGRGPLEADIQALAARDERVRFRGVFDAMLSQEILAQYDVLLLPSRRGEGMPMAMIEAMSVGVIPLCTPISSVAEVISDFQNGALTPPRQPARLAEVMTKLTDDGILRRTISANARAYSQAHFSAEKNCRILADHYTALLDRSH